MKLLLALTLGAAPPADRFGADREANLAADIIGGLFGLVIALMIVFAVMRARKRLPGTALAEPVINTPFDPETELRLKLGQWKSSMLILITVTALSMTATWIDRISYAFAFEKETFFVDYIAGPLGDSLSFHVLAFIPVLVWHLADLIERPRLKRKLIASLSSHGLMTGMLVTVGLGFFTLTSGWAYSQSPCGGMFMIMSQACMGPAPAVMLPTILLMLALPLITLLKLAVALWSRLGPRP